MRISRLLKKRLKKVEIIMVSQKRSIASFFGSEKKPTVEHSSKSPVAKAEAVECTLKGFSSSSRKQCKLSELRDQSIPEAGERKCLPPTCYDPMKENYDPIQDACWLAGEQVPFLALCLAFRSIEETSSTLKRTAIATNFFTSVILLSPCDFVACLYLCMGEVAPAYEGLKLGIGDAILIKAIADTTGRNKDQLKQSIREDGDLGVVAEKSKVRQSTLVKPKSLTVERVFESLREIASTSGDKATSRKSAKIQSLYSCCQLCESRYLVRILQKNLRIGLREPLVLNALAHAAVLVELYDGKSSARKVVPSADDLKQACVNLRAAYCVTPSFEELVPALLNKGWRAVQKECRTRPGMPIKPMLALPMSSLADIAGRFDESTDPNAVIFEYKYDGERAQIHYDKHSNCLSCYSRNQENQTGRYPELVGLLPSIFSADHATDSFIMDAEIVAYDNQEGVIRPFQVLLTRKYKNVTMENVRVNVCVMAFDLLLLNGNSLLDTPLRERRELLHHHFVEIENRFMFARSADVGVRTDDAILEAIDEAVTNQCEGLMAKLMDSVYQVNKRSPFWGKLKKDYLNKVGDTLDLVVMGGYHGAGKRTGTYGGFLLGCYDPISEEIQSICRIGTGLSDAALSEHQQFFSKHVSSGPSDLYRYDATLAPDHWFEPVQVWEVKAADMSLSNVHQAARDCIEQGKGVSLRFPRFVRVRDDKSPQDASDSATIVMLYNSQSTVKPNTGVRKSSKPRDSTIDEDVVSAEGSDT